MPIVNGTDLADIGKLYIFNSGSPEQISEVYVRESGGDSLIYKAEEVIYDGVSLASGYTLTSYGKEGLSSSYGTHGLFFAKPRYNAAGHYKEYAWAYIAINCSNFSRLTVTYSLITTTYDLALVGLANVVPTDSNREVFADNAVWSVKADDDYTNTSTTTSVDLTSVTGTKYLGVYAYNTQGNQTDAVITRIVLE